MYGGTEGFGFMQSPKDAPELLDAAAYYPTAGTEVTYTESSLIPLD